MLQIAVDDHTAVPRGRPQPGENGGLLTEIAAEAHPFDPGIFIRLGADAGVGLILGSIIHKDQLILHFRSAENLRQHRRRPLNILLFIVGGDHHGY